MKFRFAFLAIFISTFSYSQEKERILSIVPNVHFRSFWMSTSYPNDFKNDFALGSSLKLGSEFKFKDLIEVKVDYRFFGNIWSSELVVQDSLSGQANRYEMGLFDLLNPTSKVFGKVETLSVTYNLNRWGIKAGRMGIDSDWINTQDGRLSPTSIEGVNLTYHSDKVKLEIWGISKISVRGTSQWLSIGESIGVFPTGKDYLGKPAQYFQNTESKWIGLIDLSKKWGDFEAKASITSVQNISNTLWVSGEKKFAKNSNWLFGAQIGHQYGWGNGGNPDAILAYKNPEDRNYAVSVRMGYAGNLLKYNLNYTHVGGKGRWLSPREWGKDAWYTFIPRERNEGFSSLNAWTAYLEYSFHNVGLSPYLHFGIHLLPDISSSEKNKYNFPSYRQVNVGMKYKPRSLDKLTIHALLMNKEALVQRDLTPNQRYNKVGMIHTNLILNWILN